KLHITTASNDNDYPQLAILTHRLSGAASMFGFVKIAELASKIELLLKEKDIDQADKLLLQLLSLIDGSVMGISKE
ncbi:MAG: Hpt domain-containing protein, partial [Psychrobium sp.]|nr:Hpt domain-containing protein [Psychrobium sp.]